MRRRTLAVPTPLGAFSRSDEVRAGLLLIPGLETPLEVGASRLVGVSGPCEIWLRPG